MMPEDARDTGYDPAEEYPWDAELTYPLDPDEGDDEDD
jgi:hypothetical protein